MGFKLSLSLGVIRFFENKNKWPKNVNFYIEPALHRYLFI